MSTPQTIDNSQDMRARERSPGRPAPAMAAPSRANWGSIVRARPWKWILGMLAICAGLALPAAAVAFEPGDIVVTDEQADYSSFPPTPGEGQILGVDPADGTRSVISANDQPSGDPQLVLPSYLAWEADGSLLVTEQDSDSVIRVASDGTRTVVSSSTVGTGQPLVGPKGIGVGSDGSIFVTTSGDYVVRIDPATGDRTTVSSSTVGTGPTPFFTTALVVDADGRLLLGNTDPLGGAGGSSILRIDPATGNRTVMSGTGAGTGDPLANPFDLALEADGDLLVADEGGFLPGTSKIVRIDVATGNRSTVSSATVGSGAPANFASLAVEADGSILATDVIFGPSGPFGAITGRILRVDPVTGDREVLSANDDPPGEPQFHALGDITVMPEFEPPEGGYSDEVLGDEPVGYWRFGEPSGTIAQDSSPNDNDGAYLNGPLLGVPGALANDPDTAVRMDGVNDTVRVPDANTLDVGDTFTAEGWIKRSSTTQAHTMMVKGFQITVMANANANQVWLRKPNVSTIARSNAGVGAGAYHHVAVTKNGTGPGAVKIYIDGAPVTVVDVSPAQSIQNTATNLTFGSAGSTPADFDEFALYDDVLSAEQIAAHHAAGVDNPT